MKQKIWGAIFMALLFVSSISSMEGIKRDSHETQGGYSKTNALIDALRDYEEFLHEREIKKNTNKQNKNTKIDIIQNFYNLISITKSFCESPENNLDQLKDHLKFQETYLLSIAQLNGIDFENQPAPQERYNDQRQERFYDREFPSIIEFQVRLMPVWIDNETAFAKLGHNAPCPLYPPRSVFSMVRVETTGVGSYQKASGEGMVSFLGSHFLDYQLLLREPLYQKHFQVQPKGRQIHQDPSDMGLDGVPYLWAYGAQQVGEDIHLFVFTLESVRDETILQPSPLLFWQERGVYPSQKSGVFKDAFEEDQTLTFFQSIEKGMSVIHLEAGVGERGQRLMVPYYSYRLSKSFIYYKRGEDYTAKVDENVKAVFDELSNMQDGLAYDNGSNYLNMWGQQEETLNPYGLYFEAASEAQEEQGRGAAHSQIRPLIDPQTYNPVQAAQENTLDEFVQDLLVFDRYKRGQSLSPHTRHRLTHQHSKTYYAMREITSHRELVAPGHSRLTRLSSLSFDELKAERMNEMDPQGTFSSHQRSEAERIITNEFEHLRGKAFDGFVGAFLPLAAGKMPLPRATANQTIKTPSRTLDGLNLENSLGMRSVQNFRSTQVPIPVNQNAKTFFEMRNLRGEATITNKISAFARNEQGAGRGFGKEVLYPNNPRSARKSFKPNVKGTNAKENLEDGSIWESDTSQHGGEQWKMWKTKRSWEKDEQPASIWPDGRVRKWGDQ